MARFSALTFALALLLSSADGWAFEKNGRFGGYYIKSGEYYLDACKSSLARITYMTEASDGSRSWDP